MAKFKYWVGVLINGHEFIKPTTIPPPKMGNSMPCSDRHFYGYLTNDIKVVEWYVAWHKANGVAVYFTDEHEDGFCYPREEDSVSITHDHAEFYGLLDQWLYDPADEDLAYQELAYRDKARADMLERVEARRLAEGRDKSGRTAADYESGKKFEAEWQEKSRRENAIRHRRRLPAVWHGRGPPPRKA